MRPAYKKKWQEARAKAQEEKYRADFAEKELARWRTSGVLAGRKLLEPIELVGSSTIVFEPLEYLCACAFLESNARFTYPNGGYSQSYLWKGHPLVVR